MHPGVGAWELIRTGLAFTLTQPLGLPLYQEVDYVPLHCLLKA